MLNNLTVPPPIYIYMGNNRKKSYRKEKSWFKFNKFNSLYFSLRIL